MTFSLSRTVFHICSWWRSRDEAESIRSIQDRIAEAERAHRKRSHHYDDLKRERTARLRQQLGEIASVATLFVGGAALYTLACPLDAYAATESVRGPTEGESVAMMLIMTIAGAMGALALKAMFTDRRGDEE